MAIITKENVRIAEAELRSIATELGMSMQDVIRIAEFLQGKEISEKLSKVIEYQRLNAPVVQVGNQVVKEVKPAPKLVKPVVAKPQVKKA